jgi:tetratricopeptide (TPR) repeat protein
MEGLAAVCHNLGKFDESQELYEQALKTRRGTAEQDAYGILRDLDGLGRLFQARGQNDDAEKNFRQEIEIAQDRLGAEHPDALAAMSNLGALPAGLIAVPHELAQTGPGETVTIARR